MAEPISIRVLLPWVGWVVKRAPLTLAGLAVATLALGYVAATEFRMNSNLNELIRQEAGWRDDFDHFRATFPDLVKTAVVVVRGDSLKQVELTTRHILNYLGERPQQFHAVAAPGSEAFFRDHAFLYMSPEQLDDTSDRLAEAQPWLTAVAEDPTLRSLFDLVEDGLENEPPAGFARILTLLGGSAQRAADGKDARVWWSDELLSSDDTHYQLVYLKPNSDFGETLPDAAVMAELRRMVAELPPLGNVKVLLSGEIALQHEEIEATVEGVSLAGWLAVVLLFLVLLVGVRSGKIIIATFILLAVGVIWTSAYAMLTVGEYNTLSVVFIVMFFGLGVDFALHYSLRFQEAVNKGDDDVATALLSSTRSVGRAISLCTLTTALGFLGFLPTDYQGLAHLGIISAGGMAIAWFLTFTFLPAFYAVTGAPRSHQMDLPTSDRVVSSLIAHRALVLVLVLGGGTVAGFAAYNSSFDYSVLALKDPESESMRTLREMQAQDLATDYQLVSVSDAPIDKRSVAELSTVSEVTVPQDLVPTDQEDKLFMVQDLELMLFSALNPRVNDVPVDAQGLRQQAAGLISLIDQRLDADGVIGDVPTAVVAQFRQRLNRLVETDGFDWLNWQSDVVTDLEDELAWLARAVAVQPVAFDDLPATTRNRVVTPEGKLLSVVRPSGDIGPVTALSSFITSVRDVLPNATGRPVIEWGVGAIVIRSFQEALMFAIAAITLVLLATLRSLKLVLMILLPLMLTAVFSLALGVIFDKPINMANILVLPLIFGLGVDNGIHVVDRFLGEGDVDHLMHSSTPRAVMLSTLTTIGAFVALSLSPHAGTASIGWMLSVSVGFILVFTVFLLPVLLSFNKRS